VAERTTPTRESRRLLRRWLREERLVSPQWLFQEGFITEQELAEAREWAASIRRLMDHG
jgi:hypothetical protein